MHNKLLNKFYKFKVKNINDHLISLNYLHGLFYSKKKIFYHKGNSILTIGNVFLLILSFISIIKCKILNIKIANYIIVHNNQLGKFDYRAEYILNNFDLKTSINIIRCTKFKDSLLAYLRYPNVIFFFPLILINEPRLKKKFSSIEEYYKFRHRIELLNYELFKKVFCFLKIKFFISIDDQRTIQMFLKICKEFKIHSIGYMHYKFSKFVIGIRYLTFDSFFVWSNYFKKKLYQVNKKYKKSKIFFTGYDQKKIKIANEKKITILILMDLDTKLNNIKKIIKTLKKNKKTEIYFKFKPQHIFSSEKKIINYLNRENINYFKYENLDMIAKKIKFDYFLASISTALLEAPLYGAMPLKISSKNDFSDDLVTDNVVIPINKINNLNFIVKNKTSAGSINRLKRKIWGNKKINSIDIKNTLNNLIK